MLLSQKHALQIDPPVDGHVTDAAKGALILLVVLGHAANFFNPEPFAFLSIKFFHVAVFLLLPFVYDIKPLTLALLRDRVVRYYVPYAIFLIGYGLMYLLAIRGVDESGPWLLDLFKALALGNGRIIDEASGLSALWFLPAYLTISLAIALFIGRWQISSWLLLGGAFILNVLAGFVPEPLKNYLPMGLVNAAFLFALGLSLRMVFMCTDRKTLKNYAPLFLASFLVLVLLSRGLETYIKFPIIALPTLATPLDLLIHDGIILSASLFLLSTSWLKRFEWLKFFGRHSLQIYLLHLPFVLLPTVLGEKFLSGSPENPFSWLIVLALFGFGIACACGLANLLRHLPRINNIAFPRDWNEWVAALKFRQGS